MSSIKVLYVNNGDHDDPHESPKKELEGSEEVQNMLFLHITGTSLNSEWFDKLCYVYQHFQECKKQYQVNPNSNTTLVEDPLYPQINNDIEYGLFEDVVDSYYLDSQIKDDFQCDQKCYTHKSKTNADHPPIACTHTHEHISQQVTDLTDSTQQEAIHSLEQESSLFTSDTNDQCDFNITQSNSDTDTTQNTTHPLVSTSTQTVNKHKYHNTFSKANIHYHVIYLAFGSLLRKD